MRSIFTLIGLTLVVAAAAGWYLDWYHIHSTSSSTGQKVITLDVNSDQVKEDLKHAKDKVQQMWNGTQTPTSAPTNGVTLPLLPPLPGTNPNTPNPNTTVKDNQTGLFNVVPNKDGGVSLEIKPPPLPFFPPQK